MTVTIRERNGHVQVDIRFKWPDGTVYRERHRSPVTGKTASMRWGRAREAELLAQGKPKPKRAGKVPTLADFAPRWVKDYAVADGHAAGGVEAKESILKHHIVPHIGAKRLDEVCTADVQKLKGIWRAGTDTARATNKTKTLNNRLTVLAKLLKTAVEWNVIGHMPCEVRLIRGSGSDSAEMTFCDRETYDQLVEAARKCGPEVHAAILLGGDAGLRRGEILGLQFGDIVAGKLHVQRQVYYATESASTRTRAPLVKPTKGKRSRWVPMTARLQAALGACRHLRGPWVLCQPDGDPLTNKLLVAVVKRAERRAGTEPTGRLHVLRHTYCSHLAMAGVPAVAIQAVAGHQSLETTMRYMHLSPAAIDGAMSALERFRAAR